MPYRNFFYKVLLLLSLIAITAQAQDKPFVVATTFTVIADMARNIAGEHAKVISITKPGAEIHNYQPTPQDIVKAKDAVLILHNGFSLEHWFEKFFKNFKNAKPVILTEGIEPILIENGDYHQMPNPHAWMSPKNALIYIDNITQALIDYDPQNAEDYQANSKSYKQKIRKIDQRMHDAFAEVPQTQRWLVTSEGAFSYLARDYELSEAYIWPVNAEQQGTPRQFAKLIDTIKKDNILVIFSESTISDAPAKEIAKSTGIMYGGVLYVDSLSNKSGLTPTYIDLLEVTTNRIIKSFKKSLKATQ